jgi:hypothetical protein
MTLDDARTVLKNLADEVPHEPGGRYCDDCGVAFGEAHRPSCFAEAARLVLAALEEAEQESAGWREMTGGSCPACRSYPCRRTLAGCNSAGWTL